jgi:hypothetical protein
MRLCLKWVQELNQRRNEMKKTIYLLEGLALLCSYGAIVLLTYWIVNL